MNASISFREVIPKNLGSVEWIEVNINTGTQITLQDIKTFEKSGGYCFKSVGNVQTRNRFIYWRTYQDVLELSDVSLDVSLLRNHLRLRFTDSAVLNVSLTEEAHQINLLVVTVSSVHRFVFPIKSDGDEPGIGDGLQPQSIFCDVNDKAINPMTFCVDGFGTSPNNLPHVAASFVSHIEDECFAYFAVAYPTKLMLHVMNCATGNTTSQEVKESHLMPRFLSNLKGALIGRTEAQEAAVSMAFSQIDDEIYLLVLYRSNELRLWSVDTVQPISSINCTAQAVMASQGPQNNVIRKIDEETFCIFISLDIGAQFIGVSIVPNPGDANGRATLLLQHTVPAPKMDMADFDATSSHIWVLWSNAEGDFNVSAYFLCADESIRWVSAALEPPPDRYCLQIEQGVDPREAYCSFIFHPGRFDRNVIAKALYMFRRVNMQFDVKQLSMAMLKEQVCQAVEEEIQNELKEIVVSDEEYTEIATRLWDRFYSGCEQYHVKFSEPTGLAVLPSMDAVCIVRRQSFALLRPCEMLEHLMLIGEHTDASLLAPYCHNDSTAAIGFIELMKVVTHLEKLLSEDIKMELDKKLYQQESAYDVVKRMLLETSEEGDDNNIYAMDPLLIKQMKQYMQDVPNIELAINMLLDVLSMVNEESESQLPNYSQSMRYLLPTGALFGSEYGLSVLAETVKQIAMIRFSVSRNLFILQCISFGEIGSEKESLIRNLNYLNSYFALVWIAETPISLNAPAGFEASVQRLTMAQLFDGYTRPFSSNARGLGIGQTTLLSLFLQSKGLFSALSMLLKTSPNSDAADSLSLRENLLQLVGFINQMLWPDAPNYVFPEWLFGTCHHIIIQDYVRILSRWCKRKSHSRRFMLAVSLLDSGEPHKAVFLFEEAASGVLHEPFLFEHVLKHTPLYSRLQGLDEMDQTTEDRMQATVHYYLKVIQLFVQHSALDYIIQLANMAMNMLLPNDPQLPMFQSIIFNNHLQLGHYEEAYHALVHNADTSRRKDCLRQLVIELFQNKGLDMLIEFPYVGLQDEFENIVESRARSISIEHNEVYNFLYAFHVNKGNMRKAATVMYEQAMRLQVDNDSPNALQKRCSALLVCINCIHLVDQRYRWIAKPAIGDERVPMDQDPEDQVNGQQVVVLELEDIQRELLLAEALREFTSHRDDAVSYDQAGAEELSHLLATSGLYTAALKLSRGYDFSVLPIFECLTAACIMATEDKTTDAWSWLQKNDLADLAHRNNAADMAWALLQKLVVDNELDASTLIRKSVVNRLLTLNAFIPQWLYDSYKLANSRELLQLFVKHNRLIEAADLACEMISAMLGAGSEYFDFEHSVNVKNPQLAFPINTIDLLLHCLRENSKEHIDYEMARVQLEEEVSRYIKTVKRTTEDKMKLAILQNRENRQQQQLLNR
ncbi:uncharacterized protein Dwil_GK14894 [Drosophila willistoni]|uniref:Nuclear pore complex protein Nup160 homolog n=1 Tax=Drosophila willistoni TaxID=7260 RepID=B4MWE5_DROWI|nr:nuclear pore complex protein Nup160 homolog [Drosophila willistoni]EDW76015.1 uncharacterized protein Dwil_GK14894 [Drosophila willistoni]